jgi:ribose 5-phosphate isomerase B
MRIAIGSDHAGFKYKQKLKAWLLEHQHEIVDFGTDSEKAVDYPLLIRPVAKAVARGGFDRGIILGGSGNGEAMTANRLEGIRCAVCWNEESARLSRAHNNANMLSLGQRLLGFEMVKRIVTLWLSTPFEGGRHLRRIGLLDQF